MQPTDSPYTGPDIPDSLGENLRVALGLYSTPRSFGDYVSAMAQLVDREGIAVDLESLCTTDQSPHRATFHDRTQHYHCPLDAFITPFILEAVNRVIVETVSPVSGQQITYTVEGSNIVSDPPESTLSFGVAAELDSPSPAASSPALAYRRICPYVRAFVSQGEYEQWAAETDAYTMSISVADSLELARALGQIE